MYKLLFLPVFIFAINYNQILDLNFTTNTQKVVKFSDFDVKKCRLNNKDINITNKLALAKYEYYSNDLGLFLNVGGDFYDRNGKTSLTGGVTWKLLKNGYRDNKYKADIVKLQNQLNNMQKNQVNTSFNYYNNYNFIIYFYNQQKIKLLQDYLDFLQLKFKIFKEKYYLKEITLDKVLQVKQEIVDIKNLEQTYKIFNKKVICKNNINGTMPDFDLKYEKILKDIKDKNITSEVLLNNQLIDKKYDNYNTWSFNVYAKREFIQPKGEDFGFSLNVPLTKDTKEIKRLEKLKLVASKEQDNIRKYLYLQKNYYVFRYKLSDLINMKFKLAYVQAQLKRAKLKYKFKIGGVSNIDRIISNIDSIYAIKLQILDIKQQLLLKAYSLLYNLGLNFDNKYIKPIKIDTSLNLRPGNRSIYVWANGFKKYDNQLLIELFKLKNIKTAMISVTENQDFNKLTNFIKLAKKNNIKTIYLLPYKYLMPALDYNISEVNVYIEHMDEDINDTLNILHEEFPKYKIDVTLPKDISLPKFVNKIYSKNGDVIVIPAQNYQNELDLELFIEKIIKNNPNIAIDNLKTYMKVLQ